MTIFKRLFSLCAVVALVACGGGGGNPGTNPLGGGGPGGGTAPPPTLADLDVSLSAPTIANSGAASVTATVTALDANRNALAGVPVTVRSDSGLLTIGGTAGSVTDSSGRIQATVGLGGNLATRTIVISAEVGSLRRTANLQVVATPGGALPASIELIAGATTVGTGGDGVLIRAFVKDANNNALPGTVVAFQSNTGTLSGVAGTTDPSGSASATLSAGADRGNRIATVTARAGAISTQLTLPITGTRLTLSGPSAMILGTTAAFDVVVTDSRSNVVPNVAITATSSLANALVAGATPSATDANGQIRYTYTAGTAGTDTVSFTGAGATISPSPALVVSGEDFTFISPVAGSTVPVNTDRTLQVRLRSGGIPRVGQTINFAATGGILSVASAITADGGVATTTLRSSSAGPVTVQATVSGSATSTTLPLVIVATVPSQLVLQVSPTAIAPNASPSSNNQAQVVAKVTDAAGNPVQGQIVNFTRVADPSGGNLLQASAPTNASGEATVTYRSGAESTANNGVRFRAVVAGTTPEVSGESFLTVNQTALFIALGTGNVIGNVDPQTYRKDWVVYVTDSNGIPVNGVALTIRAIPTHYLTGRLAYVGTTWTYTGAIYACRNEDGPRPGYETGPNLFNGILDAGEDANGDGVLWPGNVIAVQPGSVQTENGRATISLTYAESYAPWVRLRLTATATVAGTESKTEATFIIEGAASDFSIATIPPAAVISPFGLIPLGDAGTNGGCALLI